MTLPTDAKERKAMPLFKFLTEYFPDAIEELVRISVDGNVQHNPERKPEDIVWAREKSTDQLDAAFRHLWDHKVTGPVDTDGRYHLGKAAWRCLAQLQLTIEEARNAGDYKGRSGDDDSGVAPWDVPDDDARNGGLIAAGERPAVGPDEDYLGWDEYAKTARGWFGWPK